MKKYSDSRWNNTTLPKVVGKLESTPLKQLSEKKHLINNLKNG